MNNYCIDSNTNNIMTQTSINNNNELNIKSNIVTKKEKRLKKELEQIKKRTEKEEEEYMKKMDLDKESIDEHYAFLLELIKRDQAEANKK